MRLVARNANVSHNAPYHHFPDKSALLAALAAEGFHELAETIVQEQVQRANGQEWGKLMGVGAGYLRFAIQNAALFQMMFQTDITHPNEHPELKEAERRAFGLLLNAIEALASGGLLPPSRSPLTAAAFAWSTVHGLATLQIANVLAETPLQSISFEETAEQTLRLVVLGVLAPDPGRS